MGEYLRDPPRSIEMATMASEVMIMAAEAGPLPAAPHPAGGSRGDSAY